MHDNIQEVMANALTVDKTNLKNNLKLIIEQIKRSLEINREAIISTNEIDKKNNNGFVMNFDIVKNIFINISKENILYGDVTLFQKDDEKKIIYGREIFDYGIVLVITDGNPYVMIEMILRNIMAGNTVVFSNNGFMYGTNQLLIEIVQSVLQKYNVSPFLIQTYVTDNLDNVLSNYANIDLIVCIGDHNLQQSVLTKSKNKVVLSGYENFDLYIEDSTHQEFLSKIMQAGLNVQTYIKEDIPIDYDNTIRVSNLDEAIAQINYNGSGYSAAIFTNSTENASQFIKEVHSKIITINTSPTIERIIDIHQKDLINEKTIIYPLNFKIDQQKPDKI